jgi:glycosyltransferase involved in cell wall biosynthesis
MVSIIVPVLNEAALIGRAIDALLAQSGPLEVIVVDGGSTDGTPEVAARSGARLTRLPAGIPPGLGNQINHGAGEARGDILMFLHCDVTLPADAVRRVSDACADPRIVGGGFVPAFIGPAPALERLMLKAVQRVWQTRTRAFGWFAGDTAPFIRAALFRQCGGYPTTVFAPDWDFAKKLRALGPRAVIAEPVGVDSRRHVFNGVLKTLCVTGLVEALYRLGADRARLRRIYQKWLPRERHTPVSSALSPGILPTE